MNQKVICSQCGKELLKGYCQNAECKEKFVLGWMQRFSLEGYREEWQPGLRPSTTPRKPRLTAADLVMLREMRIRL